jgi:hypothetical protein
VRYRPFQGEGTDEGIIMFSSIHSLQVCFGRGFKNARQKESSS